MCTNLPRRPDKMAYGKNAWKIMIPVFESAKETGKY
jgi:hypothetical protein